MAITHLSNMFSLLSVAFAAPTMERARLVTNGTLVEEVVRTWKALGLPDDDATEFANALAEYRGRDAEEVMHEIRREYTRLFMLDRLVENTEGVWRKRAEGSETAFYMINDISMGIQDFMRYCGVVRPAGYNDSVDLIDNEWYFCSILAQDPPYLAEAGLDAEELLNRFLDEHIKQWVGDFGELLARETRIPYYRALAVLQGEFVKAL